MDYQARWTEAFWKMQARRAADAPLFRHMLQVRDRYNGPQTFALPDVDGEPTIHAPVPMLLADAIDSGAMRASSQDPTIICPAIDRTKLKGLRSLEYADIRRQAIEASWFRSGVTDLILPRAYRHLFGYGTWSMIVVPDFDDECARVELRDPMTSYPELRTPDDTRAPIDCGFVYGKSTTWLTAHYPAVQAWAYAAKVKEDDIWDLVEWVDKDVILIGVIGPRKVNPTGSVYYAGSPNNMSTAVYSEGMLLRAWDNKAGVVPVGTPRRATLDQIFGQVAQMVPIADLYGRLAALNYIAAEKEVFPAIALIGNQIGRVPTLEGGRWADGRSDEINTVLDGDVKIVGGSPGPMTRAALSDTERAIRQSTGQSGLLSGDPSLGSVRSGQTVNSLAALTMDPRILEAHRLTQRALVPVNEAILATEKGYWGRKKYTCFAGKTNDGLVEYVPDTHFETTVNNVQYCVDETTEILTAGGWKYRAELTVGEQVLTLNHATGMSEWQPLDDVVVFAAGPKEMILMEGQDHSSLTTPNHRWPVLKPMWKGSSGTAVRVGTKREFETTATLKFDSHIPICAPCADLPVDPKYSDALVEAVAWFWTEGHIQFGVGGPIGGTIAQSLKVNVRNVDRIRSALTRLFGPATSASLRTTGHHKDRPPRWREALGRDGNWTARLSATAARALIEYAPGRVPTYDFLRSLTQAQLDLFINVSLDADGTRGRNGKDGRVLSQKNRDASEAFMFACILAGNATSMYSRPALHRGESEWREEGQWGVRIRTRNVVRPRKTARKPGSFTITTVEHDGIVWCPRTANTTWFARRNGTVWITGNSLPGLDVSQINVALLQLSSSQMESKRAIRHKHPLIDDAERARREILYEQAEDAIVAAFSQHIMDGSTPIIDAIAYAKSLRSNDADVLLSIEAADNASRARQAAIAPPPDAGQSVAPEATAGLAAGPAGAAQQPPVQPGPTPSQGNLEMLMQNLSRTVRAGTNTR